MHCLNAMKSSVRAHRADSEDDGSDEHDCGEECSLTPVAAYSDILPVLDARTRSPDVLAAFGAVCIVFDSLVLWTSIRDAGSDPLARKAIPKPVGKPLVGQQPFGHGKLIRHGGSTSVIVVLPRRYDQDDRAIARIRCGMKPWCSYHLSCGRSEVLRLLLPAGWKPCGMP